MASANPSGPSELMAQALMKAPARPQRLQSKPRESANLVLMKPPQTDPDAELLAKFAAGDPDAAAALLDSLSGRLYALGLRMLGDNAEAEDIVQETMIKVWKIAPDWRSGDAKVSSWAYGVARNLCLDRLRKQRSTNLDDAPEQVDEAPLPLEGLINQDRAVALHAALARLPERQRQVIVLRHLEEASNPEIAQTIGTSVEAVESLLARGKRKLAHLLAPLRERI